MILKIVGLVAIGFIFIIIIGLMIIMKEFISYVLDDDEETYYRDELLYQKHEGQKPKD